MIELPAIGAAFFGRTIHSPAARLVSRAVLFTAISSCGGESLSRRQEPVRGPFVHVEGTRFLVGSNPYAFVGVNFWQGMNLGAERSGDRTRLVRELDALRALGVTNLRVMGGSEGPSTEPWRIVPPLQRAPGEYDQDVLEGLDFLLWQMQLRGQYAVVCLTNFWFWSGGMAQYLAWNGEGPIPYPLAEGGDWQTYQEHTARFYDHAGAQQMFRAHAAMLLNRVNRYTGIAYKNDPTIMAWELANEPRGMTHASSMRRWIHETAGFLKRLDPNHLVTTGSEGETGEPARFGLDGIEDHRSDNIDYVTFHLWIENWGWFNRSDVRGTYALGEIDALAYIEKHITYGETLNKPVVLEEFGVGRDDASYDPHAGTKVRDAYYTVVLGTLYQAAFAGRPIAGANVWAWAGEGRPRLPGGSWALGDTFTGDPPHEPQGWYSVYDVDRSSLRVIRGYAARMRELGHLR